MNDNNQGNQFQNSDNNQYNQYQPNDQYQPNNQYQPNQQYNQYQQPNQQYNQYQPNGQYQPNQQYYQQGGQYQQPYNNGPKPNDGKGLSIAALVLGILGVLLCWSPGLNIIVLALNVLGIVFGSIGRKKSIAVHGRASGMATAGLVLGIIGTAFCSLGVIACVACAGCNNCTLGCLEGMVEDSLDSYSYY